MNYGNKNRFTPLERTISSPVGSLLEEYNVSCIIQYLEPFIDKLYANREPDQWKYYDMYRPYEYTESTAGRPDFDHNSQDQFPISLPHRPTWIKYNTTIRNKETGIEHIHTAKIDAGWNYEYVYWSPSPGYTGNGLLNLGEESPRNRHLLKWYWICTDIWEEKYNYLDPPQIKNRNMDDLLFEYCRKNPPKYNRQTNSPLTEYHSWVDQRLDWMCMTVEEEDNEDKNSNTFSLSGTYT